MAFDFEAGHVSDISDGSVTVRDQLFVRIKDCVKRNPDETSSRKPSGDLMAIQITTTVDFTKMKSFSRTVR